MVDKQQIADTNLGNVYYYYDLIKVTVVGNTNGMKIIIGIPLKSANQHFILYKLIVVPKRVYKDKFIKYITEFFILDYWSVGDTISC